MITVVAAGTVSEISAPISPAPTITTHDRGRLRSSRKSAVEPASATSPAAIVRRGPSAAATRAL